MSSRLVLLGGALFLTTAAAAAQQPANAVPLGVIRVPPCQPASDPEYGLVQKKPIPIGGGPMYMADRIGLDKVLADIQRFHAQDGFWWQPAPLLEKLAREGKSFFDPQTPA